jgi:hypothetical protein
MFACPFALAEMVEIDRASVSPSLAGGGGGSGPIWVLMGSGGLRPCLAAASTTMTASWMFLGLFRDTRTPWAVALVMVVVVSSTGGGWPVGLEGELGKRERCR